MKKFTDILLKIFSIGIITILIAGALSFVGYIIAICIGGEMATEICTFIYKKYIPWVIRFTSIFAAIGLVAMYLTKTKALTILSKNKEDCTKNIEVGNIMEQNITEEKSEK